jgi:hypothetical protein
MYFYYIAPDQKKIQVFWSVFPPLLSRDGNGDPIPDSPRGIPLLGDGYGTNLVPAGI